MKRIKVMVVDDSAVVRQTVTQLLYVHPEIEVIAVAADPLLAMEKMQASWPDVVVLDVEMPRMDGIAFLKKLMSERPTPVIICATLTEAGARTTMEALAAGAVTIITKPKLGLKQFLSETSDDLVSAIKVAARVNVKRLVSYPLPANGSAIPVKHSADVILGATPERVVAIGTSTGGTQALEKVLAALPAIAPGIVVVQHMQEQFTAAFAARLNTLCNVEVKQAQNNDRVVPGQALIAPGGKHMLLKRSGAYYQVEIRDGPPVNRHRPSVDVLFRSVAKCAGSNALGVIMTGMGDDGARGLKEMHESGATTVAQDEASCVVFGMPKEAIRLGAAERVLSLEQIPGAILKV